jgi:hypothetical protein
MVHFTFEKIPPPDDPYKYHFVSEKKPRGSGISIWVLVGFIVLLLVIAR